MAPSFNLKCNQSADAEVLGGSRRGCVDAAAEGMRRHAAYRAEQAAYENAKAAQRTQAPPTIKRWLKHGDITR